MGSGPVGAQAPAGSSDKPEALIPSPDELPPVLAGDVHASGVFPVADDALCPADAECIFGGGGGLGGGIERRWPSGYAMGVGYDFWFLDANGVYEITVLQMVSLGVRYFFLPKLQSHPFIGGRIGGLVLGDTFKVDSVGAAAQLRAGVEIEITDTVAFSVASAWRLFFASAFTTPNDGVERAQGGGVSVAGTLQFGLSILEEP
jgi:hypothetical protein